ncbi:MAG: hypothetical protein K2L70_00685 [Clostridia bacterium]|nr:hypothetical protein [Clostridia bacterium]
MSKVSWVFGVLKGHCVDTSGMGVREAFEELEKLRKAGKITDEEAKPPQDKVAKNGGNVGKDRKAAAKPEDKTSIKQQVKENLDKIKGTKVVAVIKEGSITKDKAAAISALKGQMARTKGIVKRDDLGEVDVLCEVNSAMGYSITAAEISSLAAVPAVIKNGVIIGNHENHKGGKLETITIAARVVVAGKPGIMGVVLKKKSKIFKAHRVLTPEGTTLWMDGEKAERKKQNKH